ncbi:hypothetical protein AVL55_17435 [Alteromonas macleodii]|uniref:Uncharacterized protein n=1 Tax=Alteromonas macleodii TaxID=28108 RepID=A0A126Q445_ALTMA|nr:carboxypeptidase regulatory-like domain-containing protein [Alteromonas macleodii]AMJ99780.1 hypothetical protein AVL55_17435 [Alteromonas macleodii]
MKSRKFKGAIAVSALSLGSSLSAVYAADLSGHINFDDISYANATVIFIKDGNQIANVTTDESGRYAIEDIEPGRYRVRVRSSDFNTAQSFADVTEGSNVHNVWLFSEVDMPSIEYFEVTGKISDLNGRTYPETEVRFYSNDGFGQITVYTDQDGQYTVSLPEGSHSVSYSFYADIDTNGDGSNDQYASLSVYNDQVDIQQASVEDFLFPVKEVEIKPTYKGNAVNANSRISMNLSFEDSDGDFVNAYVYSYAYNADETNILAPAGQQIEGAVRPNGDSSLFDTLFSGLETTSDESLDRFSVELIDKGYLVDVTIVDADGTPLLGACASIHNDDYVISKFRCAEENSNIAEFKVPADQYSFSADNNERSWITNEDVNNFYYFDNLASLDLSANPEEITATSFELSLPVYKQRGRVVDADGNRIENANISINENYHFDWNGRTIYASINHGGEKTNTNGIFEIYVPVDLPQVYVAPTAESGLGGKYEAYSSNRKGKLFNIVLSDEGDGGPDEPEPGEGITVSGIIQNLEGQPLGLKAILYDEDYNIVSEATANERGEYSLLAPSEGIYRVEVQYKENWSPGSYFGRSYLTHRTNKFSVVENLEKNITVPVLEASFKAMDSGGNPIAGIPLTVQGNPARYLTGVEYMYVNHAGVTGASGNATITAPIFIDFLTKVDGTIPGYFESQVSQKITSNIHTDIIYLGSFELQDRDRDGVPDFYEDRFGNRLPTDDSDNDGLSFLQEYEAMSSPYTNDTDKDGILDVDDANSQMFIGLGNINTTKDSDGDGWPDVAEILYGLDPNDTNIYPVFLSELSLDNESLQACLIDSMDEWRNTGAEFAHDIKHLRCYDVQLESLAEISLFANLERLDIGRSSADIDNFSELVRLRSLKSLNMGNLVPKSFDFLAALEQLEQLDIKLEGYSGSFEVFEGLTNLTSFSLNLYDYGGDISWLSGMSQLRALYLNGGTNIGNIDFLLSLVKLETLSLYSFQNIASEMSKLAALTSLERLYMDNTAVEDMEWITSLINLRDLSFSGQEGLDFSPLRLLTELRYLVISNSGLTDIEFLRDMSLEYLYLNGNNISDISVFESLTQLRYLSLWGNEELTCLEGSNWELTYEQLVSLCPFAEQDSDGDGIPDSTDSDDDNDGILDENDSRPLVYDASIINVIHLPHATDKDFYTLGIVKQVSLQGDIQVDIYDSAMSTKLTELSWPRTYANAEVIAFEDINGNGFQEVGLFGFIENELDDGTVEQKPQLYVIDSSTAKRVNVYNWPANWTDMSLVKLDDLNGDGVADFGLQGLFFDGDRPQLLVKDAVSGDNIARYAYPKIQEAPMYHQLSDMNGDGIGEVGLFGRLSKNNKIQIKVTSGSDDKDKMPAYNFADNWENISWHKLHDIDFDGVIDFGLFGKNRDDGRWQLFTKSGTTRVGSLGIYAWPADLTDVELVSVSDMNFDGVPEVGVFGLRTSSDRYQLIIKDGSDRSSVLMSMGWPTNNTFVSLHVMGDMNADGIPEVGMVSRRNNESYFISIKDGSGGNYGNVELGDDWSGEPRILVVPGNGDSLEPSAIAFGNRASGNESIIVL